MSRLFQQLVDAANTASADHLALIEESHRWTYDDLLNKATRLASSLSQQGIQPGDRVAMMFLNQKEFLVSFYALLQLGAVAVPINVQLPPEDILYVILNSGSRLILTTALFAPHFQGKPIPILVANQEEKSLPSWEEAVENGEASFQAPLAEKTHELRVLMYTSGTTGKPKGVMLSEDNFLANLEGIEAAFHFTPQDTVLLALPLFHAYGLTIGIYALKQGAKLVLVPRFTPKKILHALVEEQVTVLPLVPTMYTVLLEAVERFGGAALQKLRMCISGGASLPVTLLQKIEAALPSAKVLEGYGLTETSPVVAVNRPERGSIAGSVGKPLHNVAVKLLDDQGNEVPVISGQASGTGEIWVQGGNVMMGYYQLPEETAKVLTADGWFATGDLGHFDGEGNLYISGGRKKDLIIKAGENISPLRIEQILYQHPAILEASVIGVPDEKAGEEILACVQLKEGESITETDLKKFCRQHLPPFMVPEAFRFYDELPKNPAGKIMKQLLRSQNPSLKEPAV